MEFIVFTTLAAFAVAAAVGTIALPSVIRAALSLVVCLFALAAMYVTLYAHFLAAMQMLVYAGAIMVLFVFVIMLLNLRPGQVQEAKITIISVLSGVVVLLVCAKFGRLVLQGGADAGPTVPGTPTGPDFGTVSAVGEMLFKQFLMPFELASILLLVAVVGAVVIARKRFWREQP